MLSMKILLIVALAPLLGAIVAGLFGRQVGRTGAHAVTIGGVAISFLLSTQVLYQLATGAADPFNQNAYTFFEVGSHVAHVGFMIDRLTAMMMVVVTFVSLLVHVYTIGYMADDPGYQRFFSYISLFTFSMLMLVMSNNFLQLFFGWEAVGLVSYLLIGFWFKRPTAIFANLKAFLVNRVGDFGFLLGIAGVAYWYGTFDYATVFASASTQAGITTQLMPVWATNLGMPAFDVAVVSFICICLFIGAMGKSAQVPLHVWLPDSMEGPTPISALIHAATMVTAGIFMVARMSPLFELSQTALNFVLLIGATTAFFTGLIGIVQNDIKRVVAYSTLSQLGYMTVALGASAYSVAVYHLMTHAFFKALLFLAAGSVIIGMHHEQDMRRMGGLRKYMPITYWTSLIGTLALVGTPLFSGFYSKDAIIESAAHVAHHASRAHDPWTWWISQYAYWAVLLGVFVTAFYSFRLLYLTFHGAPRFHDPVPDHYVAPEADSTEHEEALAHEHDAPADASHDADDEGDDGHGHHGAHVPHESPWVVTIPLILLAIPSVLVGLLTVGPMLKGRFSGLDNKEFASGFFEGAIDVLPQHDAMAAFTHEFHGAFEFARHALLSAPFWLAFSGFALATAMYLWPWPQAHHAARRMFAPIVRLLENKYGFDDLWIGGFAKGGVGLGRFASRRGDAGLIDGLIVDGSAWVIDRTASLLRHLQSGYLYH
ncbi:MAG: NADH-quinone oxidoreductase subunit L, partial [Arenimonas sp.]